MAVECEVTFLADMISDFMSAKKVSAHSTAIPTAMNDHCSRLLYSSGQHMKRAEVNLRDQGSPNRSLYCTVLYCTVLYCTVLSLRTRQTSITVYDFEQQNKGITMTCTSNRVAHHIASVHTNNYYSVQKPHLYWYELRSNIYNRSIIESLIMHSGSHILLLNLLILPL